MPRSLFSYDAIVQRTESKIIVDEPEGGCGWMSRREASRLAILAEWGASFQKW